MPAADRTTQSIHPSSRPSPFRALGLTAGALTGVAAGAAAPWTARNTFHPRIARMACERAGFVTRTTMVNGHGLRFVEGPASGLLLLLIHAQSTDVWSWAPVMPALAISTSLRSTSRSRSLRLGPRALQRPGAGRALHGFQRRCDRRADGRRRSLLRRSHRCMDRGCATRGGGRGRPRGPATLVLRAAPFQSDVEPRRTRAGTP